MVTNTKDLSRMAKEMAQVSVSLDNQVPYTKESGVKINPLAMVSCFLCQTKSLKAGLTGIVLRTVKLKYL